MFFQLPACFTKIYGVSAAAKNTELRMLRPPTQRAEHFFFFSPNNFDKNREFPKLEKIKWCGIRDFKRPRIWTPIIQRFSSWMKSEFLHSSRVPSTVRGKF
ncbi:hypothetical protein OCU04_012065 [Sclerotinia nivalis]|uniref:Uncharacterized protein n=1 Tax=Sclerotinia nivalis TaxID=352851 RepID=A0A9X0DDS9_9HELO|nr:hypothetical protein OCU04_012065 [Sclerotinia nivalis]